MAHRPASAGKAEFPVRSVTREGFESRGLLGAAGGWREHRRVDPPFGFED